MSRLPNDHEPETPPTPKNPVVKYVFYNRSMVEIMIIVFTFVVSFMVLGFGIVVGVVGVFKPDINTTELADWVTNIISTMAAALLGLVIGQAANNIDEADKKNEADKTNKKE